MPIETSVSTEPYIGNSDEARLEGEIEGYTWSVLHVLEVRGIEVSPAIRARITERADLDIVHIWICEALDVTSAEQLSGLADETHSED
jgi:hypothetical protein